MLICFIYSQSQMRLRRGFLLSLLYEKGFGNCDTLQYAALAGRPSWLPVNLSYATALLEFLERAPSALSLYCDVHFTGTSTIPVISTCYIIYFWLI
jgi:hypothetical protein